jgi:hypothetical protein
VAGRARSGTSPAAEAEDLLRASLPGGPVGVAACTLVAKPSRRRRRPHHLQEVAPANPDGLEALGEEVELLVRDPHGGVLL